VIARLAANESKHPAKSADENSVELVTAILVLSGGPETSALNKDKAEVSSTAWLTSRFECGLPRQEIRGMVDNTNANHASYFFMRSRQFKMLPA